MYNAYTTTTSYTVTDNVKIVLVNNTTTAVTITLPNATRFKNRIIWVKRYDPTSTANITIASASGNVQEPFFKSFNATSVLNDDVLSIGYISDGAIWHLVDVIFNEGLTIVNKTASYTLTLDDRQKLIRMNVASGNILTVPQLVYQTGTQILVAQMGAGQTTISPAVGVSLLSNGSKYKLSAQYSLATLIYCGGYNWLLGGDLTT